MSPRWLSTIALSLLVGGLIASTSARAAAGGPAPPMPATAADADAAPPSAPRVAVVVQLAVNVDEHRVDALAATLADALAKALVVDAIGGADVSRRLPPGELPEDCLTTPACVQDVGQRLDAEQLLVAVLVQVGDDLQIDITWVDVASSRTVARPSIALAADAHAGRVFSDAASRLLPDAEVRTGATAVTAGGEVPVGGARHLTTPAWITAGVGAAALAGAIGFGLSARSTYQRCDRDGCNSDELDSLDRRALTADVCLGVAAGAGIATAVLFFTSGTAPPAGLEVRPTPGGVALIVGARF